MNLNSYYAPICALQQIGANCVGISEERLTTSSKNVPEGLKFLMTQNLCRSWGFPGQVVSYKHVHVHREP